jgi:thiosulfate/3-mercaptopyruvate sulfurtransferase
MNPDSASSDRKDRRKLPASIAAWLAAQGFPSDDPEAADSHAMTPLMQACRLGDGGVVDGLLAAGVTLDAVNADGNNALWLACYSGDLGIIDRLLASGIDIDRQNDSGATCLMYAASSGKSAVVSRLLSAGADNGLRNQDDFTALELAADLDCLRILRAADGRRS